MQPHGQNSEMFYPAMHKAMRPDGLLVPCLDVALALWMLGQSMANACMHAEHTCRWCPSRARQWPQLTQGRLNGLPGFVCTWRWLPLGNGAPVGAGVRWVERLSDSGYRWRINCKWGWRGPAGQQLSGARTPPWHQMDECGTACHHHHHIWHQHTS